MSDDLREQAAKAAREYVVNRFGSGPSIFAHSEERAFIAGHAAGYADGAREFVFHLWHDDCGNISARFERSLIDSLEDELTRFLAAAPGTGIAENETNRPEGDKE
jgi:hypothetical protein